MNRIQFSYKRTVPMMGGQCRTLCPGGGECVCNNEHDHRLHICKDPGCYCHSRERYDGLKAYSGVDGGQQS